MFERYPDQPIRRKYLTKFVHKYITTGSVEKLQRAGRKPILKDKQIDVSSSVVSNPSSSTKHILKSINFIHTK